jgi:glyoxylase-like metal-dependent hydrolase (beta-lactamase superfamily II)
VNIGTPKLDTLLQGYRIGTDQGDIAFCGINMIEGLDENGTLKRILVDTGHAGRRPVLEAELAKRGLTAADIDIVVCTHSHWDHVENLNIFDQAQIVMHRNERRYLDRGPHKNDYACPDWIVPLFESYQSRIREVEEGVQIIPGVEILDAPGHSAGTIAVKTDTVDGIAVITGDSIQNATVAVERRNALVFWNDAMATRTIDKLVSIADVIYPGHDQAFRLDAHNNVEYVQEFQLTLTETARDQPGLTFDPSTALKQHIMPGIEEQRLPD